MEPPNIGNYKIIYQIRWKPHRNHVDKIKPSSLASFPMIDKATALEDILRRLDKLPDRHCLDLRTYKRNRSLLLRRIGPDSFEVWEDGYVLERHVADRKGMRKLLKTLFKREFPRSTKLRLYQLGECDPTQRRELKKL